MTERDKKALEKIREHALEIMEHASDCSDYYDFCNDKKTSNSCAFDFLQIGELAGNSLSDEIKQKISNVPWGDICGMRNRIVHGYADVDMHIIWNTIIDDVPVLVEEIETTLGNEAGLGDDCTIDDGNGNGRGR